MSGLPTTGASPWRRRPPIRTSGSSASSSSASIAKPRSARAAMYADNGRWNVVVGPAPGRPSSGTAIGRR